MAPNSATGISFVFGVCAAVWFSGGTRPDSIKASIAVCGSYLAAWTAQLLISPMASATTARAGTASADRLARLASAVGEYAIYAGLVLGARSAHWSGMWELATTAVILLSVRQTLLACSATVDRGARFRRILNGSRWRFLGSWRTMAPAGAGRLALIAVVTLIWGPRIALEALLGWGIAAICHALFCRPEAGRTRGIVTRFRDDGAIALWLGRLVRGNLAALPPALVALAATATLARLGLANLPGVLVLTPVVAMLVAAPGSSYPHAGPLDWLVPAMLQAGQFIYVAALGFSRGVPAPVTFTLCAVIALHYLMLAGPRRAGGRRPRLFGGLGWEGRMLVVGVGAMIGLTTFAYAALAAYLWVLICSRVITEGAAR